jgi:hypothetical protein
MCSLIISLCISPTMLCIWSFPLWRIFSWGVVCNQILVYLDFQRCFQFLRKRCQGDVLILVTGFYGNFLFILYYFPGMNFGESEFEFFWAFWRIKGRLAFDIINSDGLLENFNLVNIFNLLWVLVKIYFDFTGNVTFKFI